MKKMPEAGLPGRDVASFLVKMTHNSDLQTGRAAAIGCEDEVPFMKRASIASERPNTIVLGSPNVHNCGDSFD
jgi:hypothetical protein